MMTGCVNPDTHRFVRGGSDAFGAFRENAFFSDGTTPIKNENHTHNLVTVLHSEDADTSRVVHPQTVTTREERSSLSIASSAMTRWESTSRRRRSASEGEMLACELSARFPLPPDRNRGSVPIGRPSRRFASRKRQDSHPPDRNRLQSDVVISAIFFAGAIRSCPQATSPRMEVSGVGTPRLELHRLEPIETGTTRMVWIVPVV